MQGLHQFLVGRHHDDASVARERHTVDGEQRTIGIALVEEGQAVVHVGSHFREVAQPQRVVGRRAGRHVANPGHIDSQFRLLYPHGGFHDGGTRLIVFGLHLALIGGAGLSGTGAEDRSEIAIVIDINRQCVGIVVVLQRVFKGCDIIGRTFFIMFFYIININIPKCFLPK